MNYQLHIQQASSRVNMRYRSLDSYLLSGQKEAPSLCWFWAMHLFLQLCLLLFCSCGQRGSVKHWFPFHCIRSPQIGILVHTIEKYLVCVFILSSIVRWAKFLSYLFLFSPGLLLSLSSRLNHTVLHRELEIASLGHNSFGNLHRALINPLHYGLPDDSNWNCFSEILFGYVHHAM
jgi:hypothetical protein